MPERFVIAWDLETIPDLSAVARVMGLEGETEANVRAALGSGFPKHPLHKIACIGALVATRQPQGWQVEALGAPHIGERSEAELIGTFVDRIGELRPQLVTFNGNSFDLPVLRYRAMVNRVSATGLQVRPYFHRYSNDALDLCDVLASYGSGAKVKLDDLCKIIGIAGKPPGVDGSQVEAMMNAGEIDKVADYCETDVLNTYRVWLVYEHFRGTITTAELNWSESQICDFLRAKKSEDAHLHVAMGTIVS